MQPQTSSVTLERGTTGYLTITQAASRKGCSTETLRRRVANGILPSVLLDQRTRLIRIEDVDALDLRGKRFHQ